MNENFIVLFIVVIVGEVNEVVMFLFVRFIVIGFVEFIGVGFGLMIFIDIVRWLMGLI